MSVWGRGKKGRLNTLKDSKMPSTGLSGPYALNAATIDKMVTKTSPGAYALGEVNSKNTFIVKYVGRSDTDLKARLQTHASAAAYPTFKADYFGSPKAAF